MNIRFQKNGLTKEVAVGFSWTVFFFGPLPFAFREQWIIFLAMLAANIVTSGIAGIIMAFFANKITARALIEDGWTTIDRTPISWGYTKDLNN